MLSQFCFFSNGYVINKVDFTLLIIEPTTRLSQNSTQQNINGTSICARILQWINNNIFLKCKKNLKSIENTSSVLNLEGMQTQDSWV
jgi:hypothetical protein